MSKTAAGRGEPAIPPKFWTVDRWLTAFEGPADKLQAYLALGYFTWDDRARLRRICGDMLAAITVADIRAAVAERDRRGRR